MIITDSHTHLYSEEFSADLPALLKAAAVIGVTRFFMPNIDSTSIQNMLEVEEKHEGCQAMMGLHPCSVKENWKEEMAIVEQWLGKRKFVAIGEIGIDLFWDKTFIEEQKIVFKRQVELANEYKLPIVIHTRDSLDVVLDLLADVKKESPCGIFHCFTGNSEQAKKITGLGFYLGIGGVITFKNGGLDKTIPEIPLENIVLETDAPYLAPVPYRGKRNEPSYIVRVAEKIAELKDCSMAEVANITTENTKKIFGV